MRFFVTTLAACLFGTAPVHAESLVSKPGFVAVDHVERKKELSAVDALDYRCDPGRIPDHPGVLSKMNNRRTDKAYNGVSKYFRRAGGACMAGREDICKEIREYVLAWVESGQPKMPWGADPFGPTMTVNMRLLAPMIPALAVAEADRPVDAEDKAKVRAWLKEKVDRFEHGMRGEGSHYDIWMASGGVPRAANNHAVQSSIAAMSYGALVGDDSYFKTGVEQWHITLGSMRKDGSLPIETRRGARAIFYTGRTISGLIQLAERARAQGLNLFRESPDEHRTIHQAVKFMLDALEDPKVVFPYAEQDFRPGSKNHYKDQTLGGLGSTMGWVASYVREFPKHPNVKRMREFPSHSSSLARAVDTAMLKMTRSRGWGEWIGVNAGCFYSAVEEG